MNNYLYCIVILIFTYMIIRYTKYDSLKNKGELLLFDDINNNKTTFSTFNNKKESDYEDSSVNKEDSSVNKEDESVKEDDNNNKCINEQDWVKRYNELRKDTRMGDAFKLYIKQLQKSDIHNLIAT